jgi:hypothetical protein
MLTRNETDASRRAVCRALRRLPEFSRHEITRVCLPNFTLPNKNDAVFKVCTDVRAGMLLLQAFLSIRQIDIELDLAEFLYRSGPTNNRALSCALVLTFRLLEDLRNCKYICESQCTYLHDSQSNILEISKLGFVGFEQYVDDL